MPAGSTREAERVDQVSAADPVDDPAIQRPIDQAMAVRMPPLSGRDGFLARADLAGDQRSAAVDQIDSPGSGWVHKNSSTTRA